MGVDKTRLTVGGVTLLDRVLYAARPLCDPLVVVGGQRPTPVEGVRFVQEDSPGGGPVPAVLAGLDAVGTCDAALVLAADLPLLGAADLSLLVGALEQHRGAAAAVAARDDRGRANPLLAAYRRSVLDRAARALAGPGVPAARLLPASVVVVDLDRRATLNVNRPADLAAASASLASTNSVTP